MPFQKLSDLLRSFLLIGHSGGERRQVVYEDRPGALGGEHPAKVFAVEHQRVQELFRSNHRASHVGAKPANVFGQAVDHDVGPQLQRALAVGSGEGIVDQHQHLALCRTGHVHFIQDRSDRLNVDEVEGGIHRSFEVDDPRPGINERPDFRLVRSGGLPDHQHRRDSNYRALGVSMSLTGSVGELVESIAAFLETQSMVKGPSGPRLVRAPCEARRWCRRCQPA